MKMSLAIEIVANAYREIAGREPASLDEELRSLGITPPDRLTDFILRILQAATQSGYQLDPTDFTRISPSNTFRDVTDMIVSAAISPPKICSFGHPAGAGQSTCAYGHPA